MADHGGGITTLSTKPSPNHHHRRLVLFPLPLQGHINPMLQLANILHDRGFKITIIHTHFNSPNPSNYPHFTFQSISDGLSKFQGSTSSLENLSSVVSFLNESCIEPFRRCLARLLEEEATATATATACLITDALWCFTQSVADGLKLQRIVLRTSSISCICVYAALGLLRDKGLLNICNQDSQDEEPVPGLAPMTGKDVFKILNVASKEEMLNLTARMIHKTKEASAIIWNTFRELEEPSLSTITNEFPVPSFPIGPFHKYFSATSSSLLEQDRSFISWLDLQATTSVVYVSFGSIAQMGETEFIEMAWGLANSKQPFLWVVRPGSIYGSEWIESLPKAFIEEVGERGRIVKWAPQQEVLSHPATGAFWTHNGWNSTLESICEGVPMICSPRSVDQPINARYVNDVWRIGVLLENGMGRGEIERTITRVMVHKEGTEMRERAKLLKEKVNLSLEKGGSSYKSLENLVNYILSF